MKNRKLLKTVSGTLILLSSFNDIYAEETKVLNLDPFRVEIVGNRMGDADSEKLFKYAEYLYKNKRYNDALPYLEKIKKYSRSDIVDDAVYLLGGIYVSNYSGYISKVSGGGFITEEFVRANYAYLDKAFVLYEQLLFTHPNGNIIKDNHVRTSLESILDWCIKINDYPHTTWAFEILANYPGINDDYMIAKKNLLADFLRKDISDISATHFAKIHETDDQSFANARNHLYYLTNVHFGFFNCVKMHQLMVKLGDTTGLMASRCPMTDKLLNRNIRIYPGKDARTYHTPQGVIQILPADLVREFNVSYQKGTTLEHFLKDIGIKDPMKWWETLE